MTYSEYRQYDGCALGELVLRGEVRAAELLELAIERTERVNPKLNALVVPLYDTARARARSMDAGRTDLGASEIAAAGSGAGRGAAAGALGRGATTGAPGRGAATGAPGRGAAADREAGKSDSGTAERQASMCYAGVPVLTKDLYQEIAGVTHSMGNRGLKSAENRETENSEIVERWYAAGAVIFGRTNTPEFGLKGITESEAWGAARNPWDRDHTPGGSSGGSAALVAAGAVPFAGGNDGGGSIRIPAACCGVFGLKPGRGRTPWGPRVTELANGLASNHGLTRSVRDSAAMLDAVRGPEPGSLFRIQPPPRPYLEEMGRPPGRLRIAFSTRSPIGTPVHHEAIAAVHSTVKLLESLGHHVEEADPPVDGNAVARDWLMLWFAEAATAVQLITDKVGRKRAHFETDTVLAAAFGRSLRANEYTRVLLRRQHYMMQLDHFFANYDLYLTPTLATPPVRVGELAPPPAHELAAKLVTATGTARLFLGSRIFEKLIHDNLKHTPFTQLANLTGVPAMSVPLHWTKQGLPLGVHFMGAHGDESLLFRLASQLESAQPWFHREPKV